MWGYQKGRKRPEEFRRVIQWLLSSQRSSLQKRKWLKSLLGSTQSVPNCALNVLEINEELTWLLSALTLKYVIMMYPPPFVHVLLWPRLFSLCLQAQPTKLTEGSFSLSSSTRTFLSLSAHNEAFFLWYAYCLKLRNAELIKNLYHLWFHCLDRLLLPRPQVLCSKQSKC